MKAVLLDKPGSPSSLRIGEISIPRPGVDEALVRVCATSLNPVDYKVAARGYEGIFLILSRFTTSVWEELWPRRLFAGGKRIWVEWRRS